MEHAGPGESGRRLPPWVRVLDGAALALVAVLAWKVLSADTRAGIFGFIPPVRTHFLIFAIAGLLLVRHTAWPRPSTFARWNRAWERIADGSARGMALRTFVATRLMVFVVAVFAVAAFGLNKPGFVLNSDPMTNLPARFDAGWYGGIALDGYDHQVNFERQRNIAFFPALPMLMRPVGVLFGTGERGMPPERRMARMLWAGVFVSLAAFLLALWYLARLGAEWLDPERAAAGVLLLAAYPFACFYNAPYTESLFLLGAVAATYHFSRSEWIRAGAWGCLVGLTRPNGFLLAVPLVLLALQRLRMDAASHSGGRQTAAALAAAVMPVAGMLAFTVYLHSFTGVWFAWSRSHAAWGRSYTGFEPLLRGFDRLESEGIVRLATSSPFNLLNALGAAFALVMIWPVARRIGAAWALYIAVSVIPPMFAGGALSLGRMTSTLFPVFLALAAILPPRAVPPWVAAFAILQGLCAALFFTWRELF
jgi:hypothetical protein